MTDEKKKEDEWTQPGGLQDQAGAVIEDGLDRSKTQEDTDIDVPDDVEGWG